MPGDDTTLAERAKSIADWASQFASVVSPRAYDELYTRILDALKDAHNDGVQTGMGL